MLVVWLRGVRISLGLLVIVFGGMTLWASSITCPRVPADPRGELFSPELANIDTVDKAEVWIRGKLGPHASEAEIADQVTLFMQRRFYHGLSTLKPCDNWLASLTGLVSETLAAPVRPDDILKYRRAICSQQAIVLQALFARFGLQFATVGINLPPHMMAAAKIDGVWAVYDSDMEPHRRGLVPVASLNDGRVWKKLYAGKAGLPGYGPGDIGDQWARAAGKGGVELKWINQNPAPRGAILHATQEFLSHFGWLVFLLLFLLSCAGPAGSDRHARLPLRYLPPHPLRVRITAFALAPAFGRIATLR